MSSIPPRRQRDWLVTKEAADYLGVSKRFLITHKNLIRPTHLVAGKFRYAIRDLDEWLQDQRYDTRAGQ